MKRRAENRFIFHANAVALAARIRRPEDAFVPAVASACLPVTGGIGSGASEGDRFRETLSWGRARTEVFGDYVRPEHAVAFTNGNYGENRLPTQTRARATIEEVRIADGKRVLEIEVLEAGLMSYSDRRRSTEFRSLTAEFRNVRVDGVTLAVKTHTEIFTDNPTFEKLAQTYAESQEFRARFAPFLRSAKPVNPKRRGIPRNNGIIYTTVVTALEWQGTPPPGTRIDQNRLDVEGFGSVFFGELLIEQDYRRLTLIRFELGSPTGGDGSLAEVQSNGSSWPPHRSSK